MDALPFSKWATLEDTRQTQNRKKEREEQRRVGGGERKQREREERRRTEKTDIAVDFHPTDPPRSGTSQMYTNP